MTSYVDEKVMTQGVNTQKATSRTLQQRVNARIERAAILNIRFTPKKAELIHIIWHVSRLLKEADKTGVTLYGVAIPPRDHIKSQGVWIDHRVSFKTHAAAVNAAKRQVTGYLLRITKRRGVTLGAIHHLATTTSIPAMIGG